MLLLCFSFTLLLCMCYPSHCCCYVLFSHHYFFQIHVLLQYFCSILFHVVLIMFSYFTLSLCSYSSCFVACIKPPVSHFIGQKKSFLSNFTFQKKKLFILNFSKFFFPWFFCVFCVFYALEIGNRVL